MILGRIFKILDSINIVFSNIGVGCIAVVSILLFFESIVRLIWNVSIITVDEIGGLGMYLFIILNISALYRNNHHLSTDILVNKFPKKVRHVLELFLHLLTFLFGCLVTYLWCKFIFIPTFETKRYLPMTGITEWPFHMIGVIGWVMLVFTAVERFVIEASNYFGKINYKGES